jgi:ribosome-associated protein
VNLESLPQSVRLAVEAAQNKKAGGITVLDLHGLGAFTEYFVICTGYSTPQIKAICDEVEEVLYREL